MIYNQDCMEAMKEMSDNQFELAIVDPPYGIDASRMTMGRGSGNDTKKHDTSKKWDITIPKKIYFDEVQRVSKNQIIWGGNYFPYLWQKSCKGFIFWYKANPVPNFADGELAWTSFNKVAKMFDFRYYGNLEGNTSASIKHHPTQKPICLYEWLLMNYAKEGDKILDTHLGSGSIAIACHNLGYDLTACELDKEY